MTERTTRATDAGDACGDTDAAETNGFGDTLSGRSFEALFNEIGKLTRELHDAAARLAPEETRLSETQRLILDARERLDHFLRKSAQVGEGALGSVETMIPLSHLLVQQAEAMREALDGGLAAAEANEQMRHFIDNVEHVARRLRKGLSEVLVAQEYQDLTGDVVQRAVELIDEIGHKQLALVQACADPAPEAAPPAKRKTSGRSERAREKLERLGF